MHFPREVEVVVLEDKDHALITDSERGVLRSIIDVACENEDGLLEVHDEDTLERILTALRHRLQPYEVAIRLANCPCGGGHIRRTLAEMTSIKEWEELLKWVYARSQVDPSDPFDQELAYAFQHSLPAMRALVQNWPQSVASSVSPLVDPANYWWLLFRFFLERSDSPDFKRAWDTINQARRGLLRPNVTRTDQGDRTLYEIAENPANRFLRAPVATLIWMVSRLYRVMKLKYKFPFLPDVQTCLSQDKVPGRELAKLILGDESNESRRGHAHEALELARFFADQENERRRRARRR